MQGAARLVAGAIVVAAAHLAQSASAADGRRPDYVGSASCATCHEAAYQAWRDSHHGWAWREPSAASVLGDFDDRRLEHRGVLTRFFRRGEEFVIETEGPDGKITAYPVHGVAGVAPLQQYLLETAPGRLQAFDIAWDDERERFYHLYPDQDLPAGDGLHWSGPYKNWNGRCAECHATDYAKNYDPRTKRYDSTQAEIGVGCEACHGPGEAHLAWADGRAPDDRADWADLTETGFTIDYDRGEPEIEIEQCATCHARREALGERSPVPGAAFSDHYRLALLREGLYHADGQILDEVYVYGSFLQSKMYARGVRCGNCHEPHSATLRADGNAVCTQCHGPGGNEAFPTLSKRDYDTAAHHFHKGDGAGTQCVNCHMPERVYMGIDGRRDHGFRVPRPDLSRRIGTPNACTGCHGDRTAAWAVAAIEEWYPAGRAPAPHFGEVFHAARRQITGQVADSLLRIAGDPEMPAIVRASALDHLRPAASPAVAERAAPFLGDPSPLVRAAAARLQQGMAPARRVRDLAALLDDSARSVRIEAARALLDLRAVRLPPAMDRAFRRSMREYQLSLRAKADFPEGQMALGGTALALRRFDAAEAAFEQAVSLDPQLADGWLMLARLRGERGDMAAARAALENAVRASPDEAVLLAELGVLLTREGAHRRAVETLNRALRAGPPTPDVLAALVESHAALGEMNAAQRTLLRLSLEFPDSPQLSAAQRLLAE